MSSVELFVICGCVLGIITLIVIAIYQRCHYKHNIVDMSDSIRIMQSIINKVKCGDVKGSTNDNVSLNLSFDEFREVLEKIQAVALDIQEHTYSRDICIEKLSKIHEQTAYLFSMENTKEAQSNLDRLQSDFNKVKGDYRKVALQLKLKTDEQNDRIDSLFHDTEAYKQVIRYQDEQLRNMKQDSLRKTRQIATYAENYYGAMARLQHLNDLATEKNRDYLAISNKWTDVKERIETLLR